MHAHTRQWHTKKSKHSEWTQWDEAKSGRLKSNPNSTNGCSDQRRCWLKRVEGRNSQFSDRQLQIFNRRDTCAHNFSFAPQFPHYRGFPAIQPHNCFSEENFQQVLSGQLACLTPGMMLLMIVYIWSFTVVHWQQIWEHQLFKPIHRPI